jgi:hypothetical protein
MVLNDTVVIFGPNSNGSPIFNLIGRVHAVVDSVTIRSSLSKDTFLILTEANNLLFSNGVENVEGVVGPLDFLLTRGESLHLRAIWLVRNTQEFELA